jgi:hypothetical protein
MNLFKRRNSRKVIKVDSLSEISFLWYNVYEPRGWKIGKAVEVSWSWRSLSSCYKLVLKK